MIGELAGGNLRNWAEVPTLLKDLPRIDAATDEEVWYYVEHHALMGRGIDYVDAHLLAVASLAGFATHWTWEKRLQTVASFVGLAHEIK